MEQSTEELEHEIKKRRTRREVFQEKMDGLIPWERLESRIEPFYPKADLRAVIRCGACCGFTACSCSTT